MALKRAFLINRPLTTVEEEGFLAVLAQQEAAVFVNQPYPALEKLGAIEWEGLSADEQKELNSNLLDTINRLGHTAAGKDSIAGLMYYAEFPTWYYHKFRINYALQQQVQFSFACSRLAENYDELIIYAYKDSALLRQQSGGKVFLVLPPSGGAVGKVGTKTADSSKSIPKGKSQLAKMLKRFREGKRQAKKLQQPLPRHLFVANHSHLRAILDPNNLPSLYIDNVFAGYFLLEWEQEFLVLDKLLFEKNGGTEAEITATEAPAYYNRNILFNEWVEWKALLKPAVLWKLWRFHKHLKKTYKKIKRTVADPLQQLIFNEYEKLHTSSLYFFFIYQAYRRFFKKHSFASVTLFDEYSPNLRAIVDAAKQEGIRTQAIQHGSLHVNNPGYAYLEEDERFNPWAERTLLWGKYWKDFLVANAAYPPERLFVCADIRTDVIPKLLQAPLDSHQILGPKTKDKFLILLATQPQPDENIRRRAALDVFSVAKDLPESWVVLKPHPREKDNSYYHALAKEAGCTNYSIHEQVDLFLLLRLNHVLVHCYSTVGIEAVYFGMPAIILDYLNQDLLRFVAEGVALQALNAADLARHLQAVQRGDYRLDEKKKQAYIEKYACAVDGKVSERTAQVLLAEVTG